MEALILVKLFQRLQNLQKPYIPEEIPIMIAIMEHPGLLHIGEKIIQNLDFKTQFTCRLVARSWNYVLEEELFRTKIDLETLLSETEIQSPNQAKWRSFIIRIKVQRKADLSLWISKYIQIQIQHQKNIRFSTSPLEYFALIRNVKMVDFILKVEGFYSLSNREEIPMAYIFEATNFDLALNHSIKTNHTDVLECLKPFIKPFIKPTYHNRYVYNSVKTNDLQVLKTLFPNPKEPFLITDWDCNNPIHLATSAGQFEIVKYFLENTEGLMACNKYGDTPLYNAVINQNIEIVNIIAEAVSEKYLLELNYWGMNIIHIAAEKGFSKILENLCDKVSDPNVFDDFGNFPIHYAATNGHLETLKFLTRHDSFLKVPNRSGFTPLQLATLNGHSEAAEYLTKVEKLFDKKIESAQEL